MLLGIATLLVVFIGAGIAIAGLVQPDLILQSEATPDAETLLLYLAARNVALALLVAGALLAGSKEALTWLATLSGTVQLVDLYIGLQNRVRRRSALALVLAILQFGALLVAGYVPNV